MFNKAIVGYLDVLGYQDLVRRAMGKEEFVKRLENLFYRTSIGTIEGLVNMDLSDVVKGGSEEEERHRKLVKRTKVRNSADSFIFTLQVPEARLHDQKTPPAIMTYLLNMTTFVMSFIAQMGSLLRGGISIGNHYESERERQLFIFSEAHNNAVNLESKKAVYPRIIMDELLRSYFDRISFPYSRFFYRDDDYYCLDVYEIYFSIPIERWGASREKFLTPIKKGIELAMDRNFNRRKELSRLIYYAKFHNRKVCSARVNLPHLAFDIEKYEEQLRRLDT
jgi:hypothetical protein